MANLIRTIIETALDEYTRADKELAKKVGQNFAASTRNDAYENRKTADHLRKCANDVEKGGSYTRDGKKFSSKELRDEADNVDKWAGFYEKQAKNIEKYKGGSPSKALARSGGNVMAKDVRDNKRDADEGEYYSEKRYPGTGNITKGAINALRKSKHECAGMF